jgi:predicted esterase/Ca2+-binding EF-hand superfamily protein
MRTGAVLDRHPLPDALWPTGAADAIAVVYRGVGYDGAGRAVSGTVFLPTGAPPLGGWRVVSYAHGTSGLADHCAPSAVGLSRLERAHVARWLAAGYVVAATDYEGLATPGPHPYFNGEAVADDVIDIVRAARALDDRVGRTWLVAGFSQGGHAALFVGLMASRYAPELDFLGTVALAPPVHLPQLVAELTGAGDRPVSLLLPFLLAGLRTSHPDVDARVFLSDAGSRLVDLAEGATLVDMFRAVTPLTNDDAGLTDVARRPGIVAVLDACRVPVTRMDRPVFITAGADDDIVPASVVERFVTDLERAGAQVRYTRHGGTHVDMLAAGHDDVLTWAAESLPSTPPPPPTGFSLFDANGDGRLTRDDYDVFALRLTQSFGRAPGSASAQAVRRGYRALWQAVAAASDTDADGAVTQAEFLRWLDSTPAGFDTAVRPLADAVLSLADSDGDGRLGIAEVARLLQACDLPPDQVATVFAALDQNLDGSVSVTELAASVRDFCLTPSPGRAGHWLFGQF